MAALTKKLSFATGVSILPARQTILAAKQLAQVDRFCGGRFRLGVSAGWNLAEYTAIGIDINTRGARLNEQIDLLRDLWTNPYTTTNGEFHSFDEIGIFPKPVQKSIPIWFGGYGDAVMKRIAQRGDGWIVLDLHTTEETREKLDIIKQHCDQIGRDYNEIGLEITDVDLGNKRDWAKLAQDWESTGASYLSVTTRRTDITSAQGHIEAFQNFMANIGK